MNILIVCLCSLSTDISTLVITFSFVAQSLGREVLRLYLSSPHILWSLFNLCHSCSDINCKYWVNVIVLSSLLFFGFGCLVQGFQKLSNWVDKVGSGINDGGKLSRPLFVWETFGYHNNSMSISQLLQLIFVQLQRLCRMTKNITNKYRCVTIHLIKWPSVTWYCLSPREHISVVSIFSFWWSVDIPSSYGNLVVFRGVQKLILKICLSFSCLSGTH